MSYKGIKGKIYSLSTPELVKGSDIEIKTQVVHKGGDEEPYVFSNFVGTTGYFPKDDDTALVIVGELVSSFQGIAKFSIPASGSVDLKASEEISWEQHLEDDRGLTILQFTESLIVKDSLF